MRWQYAILRSYLKSMRKNKDHSKKEKGKGLRIPLLVRVAILVLLALLLAGGLVDVISASMRKKRAIEQAGQSAQHGCLLVKNYFIEAELKASYFENPADGFPYLENYLFPEICEGLNLRYVYLYTVDNDGKRHHLLTVARDEEDQEMLEDVDYVNLESTEPLSENELNALNGMSMDGGLEEVDNEYGHVITYVMPFYDNDGHLAVLIGADCDMDYVIGLMGKDNAFLLLIGGIALVITTVLVLVMIHIWVVRPIRVLSNEMKNFKEDKDIQIPEKKYRTQDEVTDMEASFREMAKDLSAYVVDIQRLASEKAESDVQLHVARRIQNGMVPPEKEYTGRGCSVYAVMRPALEVGGDFYDVFELPMGKVGLLIGDISGKGIGAALFMSVVRRILRERLRTGMLPAKALKRASDEICRENPEGFFATVFAAIWDPTNGRLTYANAGHNPPIRFGTKTEQIPVHPGDLLGLFEDSYFRNDTIQLEVGEGLLLYTDGVTETLNPKGDAYGEERLLKQISGEESKELVKNIRNDVLQFEGEDHIFDDITLIAISRIEMERINLKPQLAELDILREYVMGFVKDAKLAQYIMICSEEWFVDIVSYSGASSVLFDIVRENRLIKVTFADDGKPFDPTTYIEEKPFEELDTGGMGIGMIRKMTTELRYERIECRNVVTFVFDTSKDLKS